MPDHSSGQRLALIRLKDESWFPWEVSWVENAEDGSLTVRAVARFTLESAARQYLAFLDSAEPAGSSGPRG